jgi:hypothetical protein
MEQTWSLDPLSHLASMEYTPEARCDIHPLELGRARVDEHVVSCFIFLRIYKGNTPLGVYDSAIQYIVYILENVISVLETRNVMGHPSDTFLLQIRGELTLLFFVFKKNLLLLDRVFGPGD